MNISTEKFANTHKAALDTTFAAIMTAWDSSERLAALNLNTARSLLEDSSANVKALMSATRPEEFLALQTDMTQPYAEKVLAYFRNCYEIVAQSAEQASKPIELQIAEMNKALGAEFEKAAKSAPVGSEAAVAAVRSGIAAANSTYDQVSKATRQVVEIAEANIAAATDAAVKAVGQAPTAPRRRKSA
jgi:phasin family protein